MSAEDNLFKGERGQQGDHGQHGARGETGEAGETGLTGETGDTGIRGRTGPRGAQAPAVTSAIIVFFLLFTSISTYMGWRITQNTQELDTALHRIEVSSYKACTDYNEAFSRFNRLINATIAEEAGKPNPDEIRLQRLRDFIHPIRNCGRKP